VNRVSVTASDISDLPTSNSAIQYGKKMPRECRKKLDARKPMAKA
jgi:hypothetical protein